MKKICLVLIIFCITGCQTFKKFEVKADNTNQILKEAEYNLDINSLKKPDKPKLIFLTKDFNKTNDPGKTFYVALDEKEFKKILKLSELCNTQINVIRGQKDLIDTYILKINQLLELIDNKDLQIKKLTNNWVESENNFRKEKTNHFKSKMIGNGISGILLVIILILTV